MYICIYIYIYIHIYIHIYYKEKYKIDKVYCGNILYKLYIYRNMYNVYTYIYMSVGVYTHTHTHTYIYIYIYASTWAYIYLQMHTFINVYIIYAFKCTCIHAHTHTHTHKQANIHIHTHTYTRTYIKLATIFEGDPKGPFSIASTKDVEEGASLFPGLPHFTLDPYLIMLSVKQGGIKYHFVNIWCDSAWDWTQVFRAIGEHILFLLSRWIDVWITWFVLNKTQILPDNTSQV